MRRTPRSRRPSSLASGSWPSSTASSRTGSSSLPAGASSTLSCAESPRPSTGEPVSRSEDAIAFDRHLDATAADVADIARATRATVLDGYPGAIEWFDPGNGLLAIGSERAMKALLFAIIPHRRWVNL